MKEQTIIKFKPYRPCKGRKFKRDKLKKLIKPISCIKNSIICNSYLSEKNKIRFIMQLFRWFKKDSRFYKINFSFKKKNNISNFDFLNLYIRIQKAGLKKLLLKLNNCWKDYKELKRRSYSLNFIFFFLNIEDNKNKEITLDLNFNKFDNINIFITINSYYIEEIYNIINTNYKNMEDEKELNIYFESVDYIFYWKFDYKIAKYEVYFPWRWTKEDYIKDKKSELKPRSGWFIREIEIDKIFPLKKIAGQLVVINKDKKQYNEEEPIFLDIKQKRYRNKEELFKELKKLIYFNNNKNKINTIPAYFGFEIIK